MPKQRISLAGDPSQSRGRVIIPPPRGSLAHFLSEISEPKKIDLKIFKNRKKIIYLFYPKNAQNYTRVLRIGDRS